MHGLNELDLVRQHRAELRREVEDIRLAQRLRSAGARSAPGLLLFARVWTPLGRAPGAVGVEDCKG
jgi:hypothetical protein